MANKSSANLESGKTAVLTSPTQQQTVQKSLLPSPASAPAPTIAVGIGVAQPPVNQDERAAEDLLTQRIGKLWEKHLDHASVVKTNRKELAMVRVELSEKLSALKEQLCKPGRNGNWHAFLKSNRIPRATADRYVERHRKANTDGSADVLVEAPVPTSAEITALANRLALKLKSRLTTPATAQQFIDEISLALLGPRTREDGSPLADNAVT